MKSIMILLLIILISSLHLYANDKTNVESLSQHEIFIGYKVGTLRPNNKLTKAEL